MGKSYEIKIFYSAEDKGWIAVVPELPGCSAFGETTEKALREVETAKALWLEAAQKEKRHIPEPISEKKMLGKFLLRLPKELQEDLSYKAREQGVSTNQFMLYVLSHYSRLGSQIARHTFM